MLSRFLILASLLWTSSAFAANLYSAIAYSPRTGQWGFAAGANSPQEATHLSITSCRAYDCRVAGMVVNGFVSLSINSGGYVFMGASSFSKEEAIAFANQACRQFSRRGSCTAFAWAGALCPQPTYYPPQSPPRYPPVTPQYPTPQRPTPQYAESAPPYAPTAPSYDEPEQPSRRSGRIPPPKTYVTPGLQPAPIFGPSEQ